MRPHRLLATLLIAVLVARGGAVDVGTARRRGGNRKSRREGQKQKFIFSGTLVLAGAVIGAVKAGHTTYKLVNAKQHRNRYQKGLEDAIEYAVRKKKPEYDKGTNDMALVAMANAYSNCFTLRKYTARLWVKLVKKHKKHKGHRRHGHDVGGEAGKLLSMAADAASLFDEIPDDDHGDPVSNKVVKLAAATMRAFSESADHSVEDQAKAQEVVGDFERVIGAIGLSASIVGALFDPSGLSIISLLSSSASTGAEEAFRAREHRNWMDYYCPALDQALVDAQRKSKLESNGAYSGPVVKNSDCEDHKDERSCLANSSVGQRADTSAPRITAGCYWNRDGDESGTCTACPYMFAVLSRKEQEERCENHRSPSGRYCVFAWGGILGANKCCTQTINGEQSDLCFG